MHGEPELIYTNDGHLPQFPDSLSYFETSKLRIGMIDNGLSPFYANPKELNPHRQVDKQRANPRGNTGGKVYDPARYLEYLQTPNEANFS